MNKPDDRLLTEKQITTITGEWRPFTTTPMGMIKEICQAQLAKVDAEHQSQIAEIFEEIEKSVVLSASIRDDVLERKYKEWEALKSLFLKEGLGGK